MNFMLITQCGSHIQPSSASSLTAGVLGEIILTLTVKDKKNPCSAWTRHLSLIQTQLCWSAVTLFYRMASHMIWNMDHSFIKQFCKDAHGHDLQGTGILSVLLVVISAQVYIRDVWVFFFMLEPGWDKLFFDYRDWSYMHIVLNYTVCLITNILEITDSSSGKTNSFLQSHSMNIVVTWKWIFQDCILYHSSLLPLI